MPIDPAYPTSRKEFILNRALCKLVLVERDYTLWFSPVYKLNELNVSQQKDTNPSVHQSAHDLAYVIYTSGSTGTPEGVMTEHHSAINLISWVNKEFAVSDQDSLLFVTSICFDLSVYDVFGILSAGGKVIVASEEDIQSRKD